MTTMTNPLNLSDDQVDQVFSILLRLVREDIITANQQEQIYDALLGIEMTPEEAAYERRNTIQTEQPKPGIPHAAS